MNVNTWFKGTELEQEERAELASGCKTPSTVSIMNESGPPVSEETWVMRSSPQSRTNCLPWHLAGTQ
jgi:hypothetical protein